jgi:hypothetical protein
MNGVCGALVFEKNMINIKIQATEIHFQTRTWIGSSIPEMRFESLSKFSDLFMNVVPLVISTWRLLRFSLMKMASRHGEKLRYVEQAAMNSQRGVILQLGGIGQEPTTPQHKYKRSPCICLWIWKCIFRFLQTISWSDHDYQLYKKNVYGIECCLFLFFRNSLLKIQEESKCTKEIQGMHPGRVQKPFSVVSS